MNFSTESEMNLNKKEGKERCLKLKAKKLKNYWPTIRLNSMRKPEDVYKRQIQTRKMHKAEENSDNGCNGGCSSCPHHNLCGHDEKK